MRLEGRPNEIGQRFPDQRGGIGHVGDAVGLARDQRLERGGEVAVQRRLVGGGDLEVVHQSKLTFPRPALIALRPFFSSTRLALADRLGLGRAALGLDDMGSGDHFRQPLTRVGAIAFLRPEAPRGDEQFAAGWSACSRQ